MSFTVNVGTNYSDGQIVFNNSAAYTNDLKQQLDTAVPTPTTNGPYAFAAVAAKIKVFFILSDQNITVKTNNSSSPGSTFSILAGKALLWTNDSYFTNPVTVDITSLFITNASAAIANVHIYALLAP